MYIIGYHLTNHILEKNRLVRGSEDVLKFTSMLLILISVISFNESDCSVFDWIRKNWDISDKLRSVASCDSEIKSTSMLVKVHIYLVISNIGTAWGKNNNFKINFLL